MTNIENGRQPISLAHLYEAARVMNTSAKDLLPKDPDRLASGASRRTDEVETLLGLLRSDRRKAP